MLADQIGHFGFDAGVVQFFADAHRRFLKPGGVLLPSRVDLVIAPVEAPALFEQIQFWRTRPAGFDFTPAWTSAANTAYPTRLAPDQLLAARGKSRAH